MLYGQTMRNKLSTFIREIPEELIIMSGDKPKTAAMSFTKPVKPNYLAEQAAKKTAIPQPVNTGVVFAAGDRVRHNVFGQGTVTEAKRMGNDTMLSITFDTAGAKKLMANFARIEKI